MPSRAEIVSFDDSPPPLGANPWVVAGAGPGTGIEVSPTATCMSSGSTDLSW